MDWICFWGFQVEISRLYRSAQIWQQLRTLRLIRLRQASTHVKTICLSSLPNEIMSYIESHVLEMQSSDAVNPFPEPFSKSCPCDEVKLEKEFLAEHSTKDAFDDWCTYNSSDFDCDGARRWFDRTEKWQSLWDEFVTSKEYYTMLGRYLQFHEAECRVPEAYYQFWFDVCNHATLDEVRAEGLQTCYLTEMITSAVTVIQTFLDEHSFERMTVEQDLFHDKATQIALAWSTTLVYDRIPATWELSAATRAHIARFQKRYYLNTSLEDYWEISDLDPAKLRYLMFNPQAGYLEEEEYIIELRDYSSEQSSNQSDEVTSEKAEQTDEGES